MKIVLAFGMSSPLSTIVVQTSTSVLPATKPNMASSSWCSGHLPMGNAEARLGDDRRQSIGDQVDVVDPVVDEEDLPVAVELANDRLADQFAVEAANAGLDRLPIARRRGQVGDIADSQQRQMQRPRDRRGAHRQHVDLQPQPFEHLLRVDAEPLLFVDDQQARDP